MLTRGKSKNVTGSQLGVYGREYRLCGYASPSPPDTPSLCGPALLGAHDQASRGTPSLSLSLARLELPRAACMCHNRSVCYLRGSASDSGSNWDYLPELPACRLRGVL